jgi:hypothetical protein
MFDHLKTIAVQLAKENLKQSDLPSKTVDAKPTVLDQESHSDQQKFSSSVGRIEGQVVLVPLK